MSDNYFRRTRRRRRKRTRGKLRAKSRKKRRKSRRRKRGGKRPANVKEEPIVGYNYKINIYWPVTSTGPQLRYGNVTGKYIGLASDVFDGWVDGTEGPQYVFKTRVLEGEDEFIGEIVSVEPSSQWNVDGGRRKKRTRRRRKRKGKTRRKRRR